MKKLLIFFIIGTAVLLTGCPKVDYGCTWAFSIVNNTDSNVTVVWNDQREDVVISGKNINISSIYTDCNKRDSNLEDRFGEDEIMRITHSSNTTIQIKVGDEVMPEIIMKRKYWTFEATGNYSAIYTLNITDELMETLINQ